MHIAKPRRGFEVVGKKGVCNITTLLEPILKGGQGWKVCPGHDGASHTIRTPVTKYLEKILFK